MAQMLKAYSMQVCGPEIEFPEPICNPNTVAATSVQNLQSSGLMGGSDKRLLENSRPVSFYMSGKTKISHLKQCGKKGPTYKSVLISKCMHITCASIFTLIYIQR